MAKRDGDKFSRYDDALASPSCPTRGAMQRASRRCTNLTTSYSASC